MALILSPHPALRSCVSSVWASAPATHGHARARVLPNGEMHIAVRIEGGAVRLFADADDEVGASIGDAVVAGMRAGCYLKDMSRPARSIGVQLRPGATMALFGVSAAELAGGHVALDDLWGVDALALRERLERAADVHAQLDVLQSMLLARVHAPRALHPAVAHALARMAWGDEDGGIDDGDDVRGCSRRHFIALFRDAVGLAPKRYARLLRFRRLLRLADAAPIRSWSELALDAGYSDQPHCVREFREFAGITPQVWRRGVVAHAPSRDGVAIHG